MTLLSADSFNRATTFTTLGLTDGAGTLDPLTWVNGEGAVGIQASNAKAVAGGGSTLNPVGLGITDAIAYLDLATADVDISETFTVLQLGSGGGVGQSVGLLFRYTNNSNYWIWQSDGTSLSTAESGLWKYVAGTWTHVGSNHAGAVGGDVMRVVLRGSTIHCYRNGTLLETATDSFNATATKHGVRFDSGGAIDNWSVGPSIEDISDSDSGTLTDDATLGTLAWTPGVPLLTESLHSISVGGGLCLMTESGFFST